MANHNARASPELRHEIAQALCDHVDILESLARKVIRNAIKDGDTGFAHHPKFELWICIVYPEMDVAKARQLWLSNMNSKRMEIEEILQGIEGIIKE